MFLLEKLPRDTAQAADEPMGEGEGGEGEDEGGKGGKEGQGRDRKEEE